MKQYGIETRESDDEFGSHFQMSKLNVLQYPWVYTIFSPGVETSLEHLQMKQQAQTCRFLSIADATITFCLVMSKAEMPL